MRLNTNLIDFSDISYNLKFIEQSHKIYHFMKFKKIINIPISTDFNRLK